MSLIWTILLFACSDPVELPPKVHHAVPANARMVQMAAFRGFLHQPIEASNSEAVLHVVDTLTAKERKGAKAFSKQTVLIIEKDEDATAAHAYLDGLEGITSVRMVCTGERCPDLTGAP